MDRTLRSLTTLLRQPLQPRPAGLRLLAALCLATMLAACSSGGGKFQTAGGQQSDPASVDFPIFYVKRYSVPQQDPASDLRMLRFAVPSADLFMRTRAAPSGTETNITARITGTGTATAASYDIKDVSVSADGTTILFAMRGPLAANMNQVDAPGWRIWQYLIATDALTQVVDPGTDPSPSVNGEVVNDVAPQFLGDGRIIFSSTRQHESLTVLGYESKPRFIAQDEDRTEPAFVLHVMNGDGTGIHQVSFNPSHDRDPTVLSSGRIMWTRWDDGPGGHGMHLYSANPDGTDLQLLYGANSHATGTTPDGADNAVIQFVKAREMQDGRVLALVRPYDYGTTPPTFGGDLVVIDTTDYVENTQPAAAGSNLAGPAQTRTTTNPVYAVPGPSPGGRFYAGFPLWDGTGRILVSWSQCRVLNTAVTPASPAACTPTALAAANAQEAQPLYSIWMFDPAQNTLQPIMQPVDGIMITDLVAAQPRATPAVIFDQQPGAGLDQNMYNAGLGELDIRSVYDFDGVDTTPAGIAAVADPTRTPPDQRQARFVRLVKMVSIPDRQTLNLSDAAFGASNYMREILGYAPVQPDGSVVVRVPANVAFQIDVLDAGGQRVFPAHGAWLQVAAGETVKCNGCHTPAAQQNPAQGQTARSHGRAGSFDTAWPGGSISTAFAGSLATYTGNGGSIEALVPATAGETMAETLSDASCAGDSPRCLQDTPSINLLYTDLWTNTATGATPGTAIALTYDSTLTGNAAWLIPTSAGCLTVWVPTCRIKLNYREQIQPLWDLSPRIPTSGPGAGTNVACTQSGCHTSTGASGTRTPAGVTQLDLTSTASNEQPLQAVSYRRLLFPHNQQTVNMGVLQDVLVNGPIDPATGQPTQVPVSIAPPMVAGSAHASTEFFSVFAASGSHAGYLSPAELRVISEWLDIGAQYFNDPFDPAAPLD